MTKSIHCAQLLAKSHSANYSSLTRNEHISQSASIRCSLWTNPNTLQPNPAPSWKKKHISREKGGGGVFRNRGMQGRKKEPVDIQWNHKNRRKERERENNPPNQKHQTQKAIQFVMNKYTKVHQMKESLWLVVVRPCEEWRSLWVREKES